MSIINELIDEDFGLTDEEREDLRDHYENWDKALERGVLVDVNITKWHATFTMDVNSLSRMGLVAADEDRDLYKNVMTFGKIHLLPKPITRGVDRIESRARAAIEAKCSKIMFGHFVPQNIYIPTLRDELQGHREDFYRYVEREILGNIDELRRQMESSYTRIFQNAFKALNAQGAATTDERTFIRESIDYVRRADRDLDEIRDSYAFRRRIRRVPLQSQLAEEQARAVRLEKEAAETRQALDNMTRQAQAEIEQEIREEAQGELNRILGSLQEAEQAMIEEMATAFEEIAVAMQSNQTIPGKSSVRIDNTVTKIRSLWEAGLFRDERLKKGIEELDTQVRMYRDAPSADKKVRIAPLEQQVRKMGEASRQVLSSMAEPSATRSGIRRRIQPR